MIRRLIILLLIVGCYPVSHMIVGDTREPISPYEVKVYLNFPEEYEKIAIIEASSDFALKDPSFDFTHQKKTDRALERLKNEAALLGANGLVIQGLSTQIKHNVTAMALIFAKTETKWWHKYIQDVAEVHFIKGRGHFQLNGKDVQNSAPYGSAWVIWRRDG